MQVAPTLDPGFPTGYLEDTFLCHLQTHWENFSHFWVPSLSPGKTCLDDQNLLVILRDAGLPNCDAYPATSLTQTLYLAPWVCSKARDNAAECQLSTAAHLSGKTPTLSFLEFQPTTVRDPAVCLRLCSLNCDLPSGKATLMGTPLLLPEVRHLLWGQGLGRWWVGMACASTVPYLGGPGSLPSPSHLLPCHGSLL